MKVGFFHVMMGHGAISNLTSNTNLHALVSYVPPRNSLELLEKNEHEKKIHEVVSVIKVICFVLDANGSEKCQHCCAGFFNAVALFFIIFLFLITHELLSIALTLIMGKSSNYLTIRSQQLKATNNYLHT